MVEEVEVVEEVVVVFAVVTVARLPLLPISEWEMLALCIGTTWAWLTAGVVSGGCRLKGATMACGTFLMTHSWLPKPGLLQ